MIKHGSRVVDTIFIHCSATRPEWMEDKTLAHKVSEITRWHKQRGWKTIGYAWVIDRDGAVAKGRDENVPGAHVEGYNTGSIGICLIGGFGSNEADPFLKNYTPAQDEALRTLIDDIEARTPIKRIRGHNEVAAKACPGFQVARWLQHETPVKPLSESTTMQAGAVQLVSTAGAGAAALGALDGYAQIVAIGVLTVIALAAAWILRERIKKWAREANQ